MFNTWRVHNFYFSLLLHLVSRRNDLMLEKLFFYHQAFNVEFHTFCETLSHIDTENARFRRNICIRNITRSHSVRLHAVHIIKWQQLWNEANAKRKSKKKREWILICALENLLHFKWKVNIFVQKERASECTHSTLYWQTTNINICAVKQSKLNSFFLPLLGQE